MKTLLPSGLMIFNNDKDMSLRQKLIDCIEKYRDKFGVSPSIIWLHAETLGSYVGPNGLKLEVNQYCRENIFLVGPLPSAGTVLGCPKRDLFLAEVAEVFDDD